MRLCVAGLVLLWAARSVADPFAAFLAANPDAAEEDLLDVAVGDPLDRALAVVYHPALGMDAVEAPVFVVDGGRLVPDADDAATGRGASATALRFVAVRQRCTPDPAPGASGPAFSSWLLLRGGGLVGWSLQPFREGCLPDAPLYEASSHADLRAIGEAVFRHVRVGAMRYGALRYETWDEAFAAPTRTAMLSRLEAAAAARPDDAGAWNRLAVGLHATGDRERAVALLTRAAELAPDWPLPLRNLEVVWRQRGELARAAEAGARADARQRRRADSRQTGASGGPG